MSQDTVKALAAAKKHFRVGALTFPSRTADDIISFRENLNPQVRTWFDGLPLMRMCLLVEASKYDVPKLRSKKQGV